MRKIEIMGVTIEEATLILGDLSAGRMNDGDEAIIHLENGQILKFVLHGDWWEDNEKYTLLPDQTLDQLSRKIGKVKVISAQRVKGEHPYYLCKGDDGSTWKVWDNGAVYKAPEKAKHR